jgi:hypothetical protein
MNAKTETAHDPANWHDAEGSGRRRGASIGVLGFAALGLWVLAVVLGIGAPLLGLPIDARLVLGVLVASGVASLLSLPVTAVTSSARSQKADRRERAD